MPLHQAAAAGHLEPTLLLLEAGALKDARNNESQGATPLFIAAGKGHAEVVGLLIEKGADKSKARTGDGATPLHMAARRGRLQVVHLLVKAGVEIDKATTVTTDTGATPLHIAVENAHLEVIDSLSTAGAGENKGMTVNGATPLHIAARQGHLQVIHLLVKLGVEIDRATTDQGATPLHIAAQEHLEAVRLLKAGNGNMSRKDTGETSFHLAALAIWDWLICWWRLVQFRCTSLLRMAMPLFVCFLRLVQKQGQNPRRGNTGVSRLSCWAFACCSLVKARADIDQATIETGATPLYVAAQECRTKIACLLRLVLTEIRPEPSMGQHRCTWRLRGAICKLLSCWSRLGLTSTKPRLRPGQHRCISPLSDVISK